MKSKNGSALFTVLIIILILSSVIGTVISIGQQRAFMAKKLADKIRAEAYAEAGANQAYSLLRDNFELRTNNSMFPLTHYGDGWYDVNILPINQKLAIVYSTGKCDSATAWVILDIVNYGSGKYWTEKNNPFKFGILAGSYVTWSGNDVLVCTNSPIHVNGDFVLRGTGEIIGDVYASGNINCLGESKITGNITTNSDYVEIPSIDLSPYHKIAHDNNQVYDGDIHWSSSTDIVIPGGIMWVNGDFTYSGSGNIIGCIIATGDINWSGTGSQIKTNNYPALVSRDGNIDITGNGDFHGLIYSKTGDIRKTGEGEVVGTFICSGRFIKGGAWSGFVYEDSEPSLPQDYDINGNLIGVSAWQK